MVLCLSFITVIPTALKGLLEVQWPNGNCTGLIDRFWFKPLPRPLCCALGQRHLSNQGVFMLERYYPIHGGVEYLLIALCHGN